MGHSSIMKDLIKRKGTSTKFPNKQLLNIYGRYIPEEERGKEELKSNDIGNMAPLQEDGTESLQFFDVVEVNIEHVLPVDDVEVHEDHIDVDRAPDRPGDRKSKTDYHNSWK